MQNEWSFLPTKLGWKDYTHASREVKVITTYSKCALLIVGKRYSCISFHLLPLGKLSCPAEWFLNERSCYQERGRRKSWSGAKQDCHVSGGYLMKIDDATEQHFLEVYMRITGIVQVYDVSAGVISINIVQV